MSRSRRALASSRVTIDISQALPSWKITRASWNLRPPDLHYSFHSAHPPLIIPEFRPVPSWVGGGDAGASPPFPRGRARSSRQTAAPIPLLPQVQTDLSVAHLLVVFNEESQDFSMKFMGSPVRSDSGRGKGTSLNSASIAPKPVASSAYVRGTEAPCPHKRSILVTSLFPFPRSRSFPLSCRFDGRPRSR